MLTPKMYAAEIEAPYPTVMNWLQRNLVQGAQKQVMPDGSVRYFVPSGTPKPETKRGPKPKKATPTKKRAKKAKDQ